MSRWTSQAAHSFIQFLQKSSYRKFLQGLADVENVQRNKLKQTMEYLSPFLRRTDLPLDYESFCKTFPVTTYADYRQEFSTEKDLLKMRWPEITRFQPTSGSTEAIKWIPYTHQLLRDFDAALGPWLYDFYSQNKFLLKGSHYWSLSWLPKDLRKEGLRLDDTELFPWWKKVLLRRTMAITEPVDLADSVEASLYASLVLLVSRSDLSFMSVWSPTYWLTLMDLLRLHRESIAKSLITGSWNLFAQDLQKVKCPHAVERGELLLREKEITKIWPQLRTLSCWTTSTSSFFCEDIRKLNPSLDIQGKGLWATEAVVTIPFKNQYVLASQSHFFEFLDVQTGHIFPSWSLSPLQKVSPIITTSGGLVRYKMQDVLEVVGFEQKTPILNFLGRADGVDMVGEKISSLSAQEVLHRLRMAIGGADAYLLAVRDPHHPYYCAILQAAEGDEEILSEQLESLLQDSFHYRLARELKQLAPARVRVQKNIREKYTQLHLKRGMVLGNIKIEPLKLVSALEFQENFI